MRRSPRVAVVSGPALLRHGLALQLRLRGLSVDDEPGLLADVRPGAEVVVVIAEERLSLAALGPVLLRGVRVIVLVPGSSSDVPGRAALAPGSRVEVLALDETLDAAELAARIRQIAPEATRPAAAEPAELTATEHAVLGLLAQGYSNAGIALLLCLSTKTVEGAVTALFDKLGLHRDDPARNRRVTAALTWSAAPR